MALMIAALVAWCWFLGRRDLKLAQAGKLEPISSHAHGDGLLAAFVGIPMAIAGLVWAILIALFCAALFFAPLVLIAMWVMR